MSEDSSEQFSLRWNNFFSNLTSGFHSLWQEEDFVDVTLAADGKFIQAHKIVLSVCSPYFMHIFKVNPCQHPIVILKDVGFNELSGLLQFMYKGEVNVYQEELANFLKVAELLQIKGLTSSENQEPSSETPSKEQKSLTTSQEEKKNQVPSLSSNVIIAGKRKRLEADQASHSGSQSPSGSEQNSPTVLAIPPLPKLEPLDFSENEFSESKNINDPLVGFYDVDSSRPVTNKPGQRLIANFSNSQEPLDSAQATFRVTSRGRLQLVQNNYVYHCNRQKENKIFWKCAEYNRTGCRGRCISIGWSVTVTHALHNHQPVGSESLDESKVISDLADLKQIFMSPRQVGLELNYDKMPPTYQRIAAKQPTSLKPVDVANF